MKLKNELIVICLILFILISISAVSAADSNSNIISVNDNDDDNVLDINDNNEILTNENDGSFADLNTTINGDSSTNIILDKDYTYSSSDSIKTGILISRNNTVIDGQGHTIDAKGQTRIFNVTATTVVLKNIKFINGNSSDKSGGAIYGYGENLRVINCTFIDNTAGAWGGAIYSYPDSYAVFVNSTFINNKASTGGAISTVYGIRHDVINCTFDSNYASTEGGALAIFGQLGTTERPYEDHVNIRSCVFTNNNAPEGSAISNILSAYINMSNSIILGDCENLIYSWGAMFFADNNWWGNNADNASIKPNIIKEVRFTKWLYFDFVPHIETSSATVSINNMYDGETGKISTYSSSRLPSINVKFSAINATFAVDNADLDNSGKYEVDFVLLGDSTLTANIGDSSISRKINIGGLTELGVLIRNADDDSVIELDKDYVFTPGIDLEDHRIIITDKHNLVIDGKGHTVNAMGKTMLFGVDKDSSEITFKNMILSNAYSDDEQDGPAGYVLSINTKFENCTFINNTANGIGTGGALHVNAINFTIADCKFINNTHKASSAGAVFIKGENANIINTLFENNTADSYHCRAGALILYDGGNLINCTFNHNSADFAGAVFTYDDVNIDDCTFINNIALYDDSKFNYENGDIGGAGAIYVSNATITDTLFVNNTAKTGAAIIIASPATNIDRSIFINNTATSSNGIIFGIVAGGKVTNSIFLNNYLAYNGYIISTIYGKLQADYNWYGNTGKDYCRTPNVSNLAIMSKWLFLNATSPVFKNDGKELSIQFNFYAYDANTENVVRYDLDDLPQINLAISAQNLTLYKDVVAPEETIEGNLTYHTSIGEEGYVYRYDNKGTITAQYETLKYVVPFSFQQNTWFEANSTFEIMKDDLKYLNFILHPFEDDYIPFLLRAGRITFKVNDTSIIKYNGTTGKVKALKVGLATITFKFDGKDVMGRDKYLPSNVTVVVNVTKAETHIKFNLEPPEHLLVGDSATLSASVYDYRNRTAQGVHVTYINHNPELIRAEGNYIIGISEGLANITVCFEGNSEYLPCSEDILIDVGRKNPHLSVSPETVDTMVSKTYYMAVYCDASDNITYISNDTSVAIMDGECIYGIGEGMADITVFFGGNAVYKPATAHVIVRVSDVKTYVDVNQTQNMLLTEWKYLNAAVRDSNGKLITYSLTYSSNDTSIVTVDEHGNISAVGEGVANITIVFNGQYEYAPSKTYAIVTVTTGESSIDVESDVEIILEKRTSLNAKLNHEGALNYTSSNPDIVTVDQRGYVYGKKIGEANITITYDGSEKYNPCTETVKVKVSRIPTTIDVEKTFAWVIDGNGTINAILNPQKAGKLNFTSNDESIIKVGNNGNVTAVGVGKTTITISYDGNDKYLPSNETIEVTVYSSNIPTSIEVNKTIDLFVDDVVDIGAVLNPSNAGKLNYTSSNSDVVSVDENGKITAKKVGEATITVSFEGNVRYLANSTDVLVTVSLIPTSIEADSSIKVNLTEFAKFDYKFSHPKAGDLKFTFSDYSVASIENGKIKGEEIGKTTLTIKFNGNNKYAASNATVEIIVSDVETTIDVADSIEVNVTETETITAALNPKEAGKLRFISNNKDIISVDGNGNVHGIKLGTATVTVIFDGDGKYRSVNKTVNVTVKDVETTIDAEDIELNLTESTYIVASANPQKAGKLHFTTQDNDIISLDEKGNVKALKVGTAHILISLDANGKYRSANRTITVTISDVETNIKVDNDDIKLVYGDETNVNATLDPVEAGSLAYESNDTSVVTVDENGNIKTVKPGVAVINISYAGKGKYVPSNKTVTVTVERAPSSIVMKDNLDLEIAVGYSLNPTTNPKYLKLTYNVEDNETLHVDENGFIQALRYGSTILTISFAGNEYYLPSNATVNVTIKSIKTEIRVNDTVEIGYGESKGLGAIIFVPIAQYTLNDKLKYTSSNPEIVSVDENVGLITANSIGKATIIVSYEGSSIYEPSNATVNVEVLTRTTNVKVDEPSVKLLVDDTYNINAILENGPKNYALNYFSSNPNVAVVSSLTGLVTARGEGSAIITVRYGGDNEYHSSEANITVSVSKYKTQVKAENSYDMEVYETINLNAVVTPNYGDLTYVSSDEDVVTVDSRGNVRALESGSAKITIRFEGNNKYLKSEKQVIVSVSKIKTEINLTDMTLYSSDEYDLGKIIVPADAPTTQRLYDYLSWDTEVFDVENGIITTFNEGTAELYVAFKGNSVYAPCEKTVLVTVKKRVISPEDYKFSVKVDENNRKATFTIELPDDADGWFQAVLDGSENDTYAEEIIDGKAVLTIYDLNTGDHQVSLRYSGNELYSSIDNATKFHIGKYKIDKNKDVDVYLGDYAKYTVHLTKDTKAMSGKTITFWVNGKKYTEVTDRLGYASIKVKLPAMKTYTVTAQFGKVKVSNKIKVHVVVAKNLNTKKNKNLKVQISLKKVNKKYLSGKKVTLKFNGKTYTAKTNSKGVATFTINKSLFSKLKVGKTYKYTVKYSSDSVTKTIKIYK